MAINSLIEVEAVFSRFEDTDALALLDTHDVVVARSTIAPPVCALAMLQEAEIHCAWCGGRLAEAVCVIRPGRTY